MALPSSGPISFLNLQTNAGGANPISISEYYRNGAYITSSWVAPNVPTSGVISLSNFYGAYLDIKGQAQYTSPGTYTWTCPAGVTSVSVLCVGAGASIVGAAGNSSFAGVLVAGGGTLGGQAGGTTIGSSLGGGTVGGGNGGAPGGGGGQNGGGGGAGGYSAAGSNGITGIQQGSGGGGVGIFGGTGAGGGGGSASSSNMNAPGGAGASGGAAGGSVNGTGGSGGAYGGGAGWGTGGYYPYAGGGGSLRYVTSYAVTPGSNYTVVVGAPTVTDTSSNRGAGATGAVRIIWGAGRAYPNTNTANV